MSGLTDWHREMAEKIAQAHPLVPVTPIRATGNHRVAQNDEPEPEFEELDLAQVAREAGL